MKNNSFFKPEDNFIKYRQFRSELVFGDKNNDQNPKLSICIPVYNRQDYIIDSVQSALDQKASNLIFEVVVVHDEPISLGDTLTSQAILSFKDDKIMYYRNTKNLGLFGNMNRCAELARGEWIVFLHDDDLLVNDYIEIVSEMIKMDKFDGLIPEFISFRTIEDVESIQDKVDNFKKDKIVKINYFDSLLLNKNIYRAPTCGTMFNRKKFLDLGGYNEEYYPSADWYFAFKFNYNYRLYRSNQILGYYRWGKNESFQYHTMMKFIDDFFRFKNLTYKSYFFVDLFRDFFINEQFYFHCLFVKRLDTNNLISWESEMYRKFLIKRSFRRFLYKKVRKTLINKRSFTRIDKE